MTLSGVESQSTLRRKQSSAFRLLHGVFFSLGLPFNLEDGNDIFLRNVGWLSADYIALGTDQKTVPFGVHRVSDMLFTNLYLYI
jgi:hypothetical protein